jgi:hypothetical protein
MLNSLFNSDAFIATMTVLRLVAMAMQSYPAPQGRILQNHGNVLQDFAERAKMKPTAPADTASTVY